MKSRLPSIIARPLLLKLAMMVTALVLTLMPLSGHAQVGVTWTQQTSGTTTTLYDVVWTGSQLVAVGEDGQVVTSPEGVTWTGNSLTDSALNAVCWTGTQLVAVGYDSEAHTSPDGVTWTPQVVGDGSQALTLLGVTASSATIVAVGFDESFEPIIYTSVDGETWTPRTVPAGAGVPTCVVWTGAQFVVGGSNGTLLTSPNGTTWTKRSTGTIDDIADIAWNGTRLVATLEQFDLINFAFVSESYVLVSSNSGTTWTQRELVGKATDVVWVGDRFVVGSAFNRDNPRDNLFTSVDGSAWSYLNTSGYQAVNQIVWTGTQAVVVGGDGYIATSDAVPNVVFESETSQAVEGSGVHFVTVKLETASSGTVTVPFTVSGTSISPEDYSVSTASPLTFAAGELAKTISITVTQDVDVEGDETVILTLGTPTAARVGEPKTHTLTILDDDSPPVVSFGHLADKVSEGSGTMAVSVDLNFPAPEGVSVSILVTGTAISGDDFTAVEATVNFAVGERSRTLVIPLIDDTDVEDSETVILTLDTPSGASLNDAAKEHTLTVLDNDGPAGSKQWQRRNPRPISQAVKSIWTGTQLIGWDYNGNVFTSPDGGAWTERHSTLSGYYVKAGAWDGSHAVLVGSEFRTVDNGGFEVPVVMSSTNGSTWVKRDAPGLDFRVYDLIWTGTQFVAVGSIEVYDLNLRHYLITAVIATSPNGLDWKKQVLPYDQPLRAVQWTGTRIVVVGGSYDYNYVTDKSVFDESIILTSTDGVTWARTPSTTILTEFYNLVWTGTTLVASGVEDAPGTAAYTSIDHGLSWTKRTMGTKVTNGQITWTGSKLVATGYAMAVSTNQGATWTQTSWPTTFGDSYVDPIVTAGTQLVASGGAGLIITSPVDTIAWTKRSTGVSGNDTLNAAAWSGSTWVSVGGNSYVGSGGSGGSGGSAGPVSVDSSALVSSPNGGTWTRRTSPLKEDWQDVVWMGTQFVAVGTHGKIITSVDGATWTASTSGVTSTLTDIAWSGSLLVAMGPPSPISLGQPVILTSPNGTTWAKRSAPNTFGTYGDVVWSGTKFIAVGNSSTQLMSSPDGINWTNVSDDDYDGAQAIASSGSLLVAIDYGDTAYTSTDGVDWVANPLPEKSTSSSYTINDIKWTGTQFVTVGDTFALTSTDGVNWQAHAMHDGPGAWPQGIGVGDGAVLAVGYNMEIFSSGDLPFAEPGQLTVRLTQPSLNVAEGAGTVYLQVALSDVPTANVVVPIKITHGTAVAADFTVTPLTFTFAAGQTNKVIAITPRQDVLDELDETFTVGFGTITGAVAGSPATCLVTILDDDTTAAVTPTSDHQLVALGADSDPFTVSVVGSAPLTVQWRKNTVNVANALGTSYTILKAQITQGGAYDALVKNPVNSIASTKRELGVVSTAESYVVKAKNSTAILTAITGGSTGSLTYQWQKNGVNVSDSAGPNPRISGATTKTLTIKLLTETDTDDYTCEVTQTVSSLMLETGAFHLYVTTGKPVLTGPIAFPSGRVAESYSFSVPFDTTATLRPATFTATGLPKGLVINAATGVISGIPEVATTNQTITITAKNTSSPIGSVATGTLTILKLPDNVVGTFHGTVARTTAGGWDRSELGGRFEMTVLNTGACTGKIMNGARIAPAFIGKLLNSGGSSFVLDALVTSTGQPSLSLSLNFNDAMNTVSGSLSLDATTVNVAAWRNTWSTSNKATNSKGLFNFLMQGDGDSVNNPEANPAGDGYGSFKVPDYGTFDVKGKLADGAGHATNTFLGPQGQVLIYQVLYANPGSLLGMVKVDPSADISTTPPTLNSSGSSGTWTRPAQTAATEKVYRYGMTQQNLTIVGAVYIPPAATSVVFDLPNEVDNAKLVFSEGGIDTSNQFAIGPPNTVLRVKVGGTTTPPNPNEIKITLTVTPSTGVFSGTFSLEDPIFGGPPLIRPGSFSGIITQDGSGPIAQGYFLLQQRPSSSAIPDTWSGQIQLTPNN